MKTTIILSGLFLAIMPVSGQTWTQTGANTNYEWGSVASSADGTKLIADGSGGVYLSTNSGATWAPCSGLNDTGSFLWPVAISADGTKLACMGVGASYGYVYIYISTNSGGSWSSSGPLFESDEEVEEQSGDLAMSADGRTLLALENEGGIYISTNTGSTWLLATNPEQNSPWANAVCAANGTKLAAMKWEEGNPSAFVSTNSGATWQETSSFNETQAGSWLISTPDGSKLIVEGAFNSYISTNWGVTWSDLSYNPFWYQASSADLSMLVGVYPGFPIYTSTNSGMTGTLNNTPNADWTAAACSADGKKLFAAAGSAVNPGSPSTNGIWTLQLPPAPKINVSPSIGAVNFSWLVPSTNMVLEESPDLNNWTTLTNYPSVDFTNLQEQLTLSATNGSGFFRLISQ